MARRFPAVALAGALRRATGASALAAALLMCGHPATGAATEDEPAAGAEAEAPAGLAPAGPAARPAPPPDAPRDAPPQQAEPRDPSPRGAAPQGARPQEARPQDTAPRNGEGAPTRAVATEDGGPRRLRFCAGTRTGNYTFAAERIAERARSDAFEMQVVTTNGAAENLRRLRAGECDIGLSQGDIFDLWSAEDPEGVRGIAPFKRVYTEYVHVLCPIASGLTNTAQFGPNTRLITGAEGSGTSETWRAFRAAVPRLDGVQRIPDPVNLVAVNRVKDSRDVCMLWVSGLNSSDIQGANAMSTNTPDRRRTMRLVGVNEPVLRTARGGDGRPMYRFEPIRARFGSYDNLIDPARDPVSRALRPGSVVVPVVDAVIFARDDAFAALPGKGSELVRAVEEAGPSIWARVSPPPPQQRAEAPLEARR